ncbi:flagellar motor switch protein FliM [Malonomonas rubra DSM 5091]|uniref:Flagellar motor switch protein FliM n=1 Tax=Malonomonas rubra DSM 5091 TaxID=1122189 RepID=A0A1M6MC15_MALRU|nr:FliM/FliN family flagellar motor switch protein [Malonomonas rubra]SHJ81032.1 flagellar motor switch protein FliM [Malonomonas rubra DSM 5091]
MEKILSKEEIADLLSAVRHGDISLDQEFGESDGVAPAVGGKRLRAEECNLFRADGPEGWKLQNFDLVLDSFSHNYAMALSTRFQRAVSIKLDAMESMTFEALLQRLSGRGAIGILQVEPLNGGGLLIYDEQLSYSLVEIVLGGSSEATISVPNRMMSAIELNVLRDVIVSACPELNKGFRQLIEIDSTLVKVVSNLRLLNFVMPEAGVVTARFRVVIDSLEGDITLVLPHAALEPLQRQQSNKSVPVSEMQNSKWRNLVCEELEQMSVELEAQLATLSLRVRDILNFQTGDVIELDCDPDTPLQVKVEGRPKFKAMAGVQGSKKAIRILGRIPYGG